MSTYDGDSKHKSIRTLQDELSPSEVKRTTMFMGDEQIDLTKKNGSLASLEPVKGVSAGRNSVQINNVQGYFNYKGLNEKP